MGFNNQSSRMGNFNITSTVANQELVTDSIFAGKGYTHKALLKVQLIVNTNCEIILNKKDTILVTPTYGLFIDYDDLNTTSLIIKTAGVNLYGVYFW